MSPDASVCPKCSCPLPGEAESCIRCGVIFAKIRVQANPPTTQAKRPMGRYNRFRVLSAFSYGALVVAFCSVLFWYGLMFTDGWHGDTVDLIWNRVVPGALLSSTVLGFLAMCLNPREGERGQGIASAPCFLSCGACVLCFRLLAGIRVG